MNRILKILLFPIFTLAFGLLPEADQLNSETDETDYPEHLTGTFTGGFGEDTCHNCHFDYPLNSEDGELQTRGLPEQYQPGKSYTLQILVERPELKKAGFQLTARFDDGSQAGSFTLLSDSLQFTESAPDSLQYVQHSVKGTERPDDGSAAWRIEWTAPETARNVILHLAANAANGDASEFGDLILTKEIKLISTR